MTAQTATASDAITTARQALQEHKITVTSVFVPQSQSRNKNEKRRSLNWRVTLLRDGREVITTDYSAGVAHCPAYKLSVKEAGGIDSIMRDEMLKYECENGKVYRHYANVGMTHGGAKIEPDAVDVTHSLVLESDALDYRDFEEWASEFGYDLDSRSAEKTYRACLDIALKMRAGLGDETLRAMREAFQDY